VKIPPRLGVVERITVSLCSEDCGELTPFGPGSIGQADTKDEFIDLHEFEQGVDLFAEVIRSL